MKHLHYAKHTTIKQESTMRYKHVKAGSAENYKTDGGELTSILASAQDTDSRVAIFDSILPKDSGAPWHYHEIDDEIFYIISGEMEFGVEDEVFTATAGDLIIAGPYAKRRFMALTDSHVLVINTPAGPSESFIREISSFTDDNPPTEIDRQRFVDLYKIHLV
jgi:quercetin dioxygenase-like cupin family protein